MALVLFLFALSSRACLFEMTLTLTIYAAETLNLCDRREMKRGFLLTFTLTIFPSDFFCL